MTFSTPKVKGTLPSARGFHTLSAVGNQLYLFGGHDETEELNDMYIFDTGA